MEIITNIYSDNFEIDTSKVGIELSKLKNNLINLSEQQEDFGFYLIEHNLSLSIKRPQYMSFKKLRKIMDLDFLLNHVKASNDLTLKYGELFTADSIRLIDIHSLYREIEVQYYCAINLVRMAQSSSDNNSLFELYNEEELKQIILFNNPECGLYLISDKKIQNDCNTMIQEFLSFKEEKQNLQSEIQTYRKEIEKFISIKNINSIEELKAYRNELKKTYESIDKSYCKKRQ